MDYQEALEDFWAAVELIRLIIASPKRWFSDLRHYRVAPGVDA